MTQRYSLATKALIYVFIGSLRRRMLYWVIGVVLAVLLLLLSARFYTDLLWYRSVGYLDVLLTMLRVKLWMGVAPAFAMTFAVASNMLLAQKLAPVDRVISADERRIDDWRRAAEPFTRPIIMTVALICGLVVGVATYMHWDTYLLWANRVQWGRTDPQFGRDLSYFMFELPFLTLVNKWLFIGALIVLVLTVLTSYVYGGIRPQAPGAKIPPQVNVHISVLLMALVALLGWGLLLELHLLSYSERGVITGLGFTDANASLVAYQFVATGAVTCFILFQINVRKPGWLLPSVALVWLFLLGLSVASLYPHVYQLLVVEPQELEREYPFIEDHLQFTRYGFGLDDVAVAETPGNAQLTAATVRRYRSALEQIRLWDPDTLRIIYQEVQALRTYYDFPDVDVDRYDIDGARQQVMIAAREVNEQALPEHSDRWEARRLIYTHGYGLVTTPVAGHSNAGLPTFLTRDMPTRGSKAIAADNPRIYFGENSPRYSIVDSAAVELDHPLHGRAFARFDYTGRAGVAVDPWLNRLAFGIRFWDIRLPLSRLLEPDSRVLFHRNVRDRIRLVAPYLQVDRNPYPVSVDGRIKWVVDCYTVSDMMPYSKRVNLQDLTQVDQPKQHGGSGMLPGVFIRSEAGLSGTANYIRNSVKAVVDAYDGSVTLYVVDPSDRVLQAWRRVFPESFVPAEYASDRLRAHFRYPQDMFRVQSVVYADYHMRAPETFYTREAAWRIPPDAAFISLRRERARPEYEERRKDLRPYWLLTRFPGEEDDEFAIVQPFSPDQRNVLTGYLVGRSDGEHYGDLKAYVFPPNSTVLGPAQVQARIDQDATISAWMTLRMQSGSRVSRGTLLTIPVGDALLYVQPLFVQADKSEVAQLLGAQLSSIPELKKVVVLYGDTVVMRDTLGSALAAIFGDAPSPQPPGSPLLTEHTSEDGTSDQE